MCLNRKSFYFSYGCSSQFCVTKAVSVYKNAVSSWIVGWHRNHCELLVIVVVSCEKQIEYSKTGDFILDLYWSGCRGDWPSALHVTSRYVIGSTYWTVTAHSVLNAFVLHPYGVALNYILHGDVVLKPRTV